MGEFETKTSLARTDPKDKDGHIDTVIVDRNRDNKWDISFWDIDNDGKPDLIGLHPDGGIKPSSFENYDAG